MRSLGLYIRKKRKEAGLTYKEFAQRCGVTIQAVWYWEKDMKRPTYGKLWAIANALACDIYELITYKIETEQK